MKGACFSHILFVEYGEYAISGEQNVLPPSVYEVSSLRRTADIALPHLQRPPHLRRGLQGA